MPHSAHSESHSPTRSSAKPPPNVVSIAGVDPSGGAGVYADIKTFSALRAYGCGVVTTLTAQNTQGVSGVHVPPADFLRLQIDTLFSDVPIHAVKIGMLASAPVAATVADRLAHWRAANVVLDPVMVAKSGNALLDHSAVGMLREALFPQTFVLTPNLPEAGVLLDARAPETVREMFRAAERLRELLPLDSERWVLLKGGHLPGDDLLDLLFDGDRMIRMPARRSPAFDAAIEHGDVAVAEFDQPARRAPGQSFAAVERDDGNVAARQPGVDIQLQAGKAEVRGEQGVGLGVRIFLAYVDEGDFTPFQQRGADRPILEMRQFRRTHAGVSPTDWARRRWRSPKRTVFRYRRRDRTHGGSRARCSCHKRGC